MELTFKFIYVKILLLLFVLISIESKSQESFELNSVVKLEKHRNYLSTKTDGDYFYKYYIGKSNKSLNIKCFEIESMQLKNEVKIELTPNYKKSDIVDVKILNEEIFILSFFENKQKMKTFFFVETFDFSKGISNGDIKKVGEIPLDEKGLVYRWVESNNGDFLSMYIKGKKSNESYLLSFDKEYNLLYRYDKVLNITKNYNVELGHTVDNSGKTYLVLKNFKNTAEYDSRSVTIKVGYYPKVAKLVIHEQIYSYFILTAGVECKPKLVKILPKENKFINEALIFVIDDEVFVSGTYSLPGNLNAAGVYSSKFTENTDEILVSSYFAFSEEFIKKDISGMDKVMYDKAEAGKKNSIWDYHWRDNIGCVEFNDSYVLFLEDKLEFSYTITTGKMISSFYLRQNDNVYLLKLEKNGDIQTVVKISKNQCSENQPERKSAIKVIGGKLYFMYSEVNNVKLKSERIVVYVYDSNFNRTRIDVPTKEKFKYPVNPSNMWISDTKVIAVRSSPSGMKEEVIVIEVKQ